MAEKKKILVVDDDLDTLDIVKIKLESAGFKVITSADGVDAISKINSDNPDLVILDVMLPKVNGFKIARLIKFDERLRHIPLFLFTARTQKSDIDLGNSVGADEYITKPFDPEDLLAKVNSHLSKIK